MTGVKFTISGLPQAQGWRSGSAELGMDLLSMLDVELPAFYAAHVRHQQTLIREGQRGSLIINNKSSSLFSNPFKAAHNARDALFTQPAP